VEGFIRLSFEGFDLPEESTNISDFSELKLELVEKGRRRRKREATT